jgi:hypothetical protein
MGRERGTLITQVHDFWTAIAPKAADATLRPIARYKWYDSGQQGSAPVNDPASCRHARTQLIAKDNDAEYVECLDCGAILEAGELPEPAAGFDESLSDA